MVTHTKGTIQLKVGGVASRERMRGVMGSRRGQMCGGGGSDSMKRGRGREGGLKKRRRGPQNKKEDQWRKNG